MAESSSDTPPLIIRGSCFCKSVSYSITPPIILSAYCHCTNCQRLTGCPFVHTVHVSSHSFQWTHITSNTDDNNESTPSEEDKLDAYTIPDKPHKTRYRCKRCGACVVSSNSLKSKHSVWGAHLLERERADSDERSDSQSGPGVVPLRKGSSGWEIVKPTAHIFYGTRMLDVEDELGKWEGYEGESERIDLKLTAKLST